MSKKPGVMIYHDIKPSLELMTDEDCGVLFRAISEYSMNGTEPGLVGIPGAVFSFLRSKIDSDARKYEETCIKRRYAVYCRDERNAGREPKSMESWERIDALRRIT